MDARKTRVGRSNRESSSHVPDLTASSDIIPKKNNEAAESIGSILNCLAFDTNKLYFMLGVSGFEGNSEY